MKRLLVISLLASLVPVALVLGAKGFQNTHDQRSCWRTQAHHGDGAIKRCVEARRTYRKGAWGLRGPSLRGWAAGWCAARHPGSDGCVRDRLERLREMGYGEAFFGVSEPGQVNVYERPFFVPSDAPSAQPMPTPTTR